MIIGKLKKPVGPEYEEEKDQEQEEGYLFSYKRSTVNSRFAIHRDNLKKNCCGFP